MHYSYNFLYFFYIDFSIISHYLLTPALDPLIIHDHKAEEKIFTAHCFGRRGGSSADPLCLHDASPLSFTFPSAGFQT